MGKLDLDTSNLNDFSDLSRRTRRHIAGALAVSLFAIAALSVSIVVYERTLKQVASAELWQPPIAGE